MYFKNILLRILLKCVVRYLFAAGRNHQMPRLCSMIHIQNFTPVISIIVTVTVVELR